MNKPDWTRWLSNMLFGLMLIVVFSLLILCATSFCNIVDSDAREPEVIQASMAIGGGTELQRWGIIPIQLTPSPPWAGHLDQDGQVWLVPDGRISHCLAWVDSARGQARYGVEAASTSPWHVRYLNGKARIIPRWYPSPLNRVYDPDRSDREAKTARVDYPMEWPQKTQWPEEGVYR